MIMVRISGLSQGYPMRRPSFTLAHSLPHLRGLWLAGVAAAAMAGPALAKEPIGEQQSTTLGEIVVTGERASRTSYAVDSSLSAMKTNTPLIDTPQSVTVVSLKQIADQGALSIGDAIRYVPGVFSAQGEGNRETLVLRGNATTGDFFVDGVRDDVQTYRDLYNIDRLEIFKGPNAMIFGRGGIGGVVNRVTRVAGWDPVNTVRAELGSDAHARVSFDAGSVLNARLAVRLTGVHQDSESYRDDVEFRRWGLNPTAAIRVGANTELQLGYEHFEDDRTADRGVPSRFQVGGGVARPLETPPGQFFGDPANSPSWTDTDAGTLLVDHRINDRVSIRSRTRYAAYDKFYQNVFPGAVDSTETTVSLSAYYNATERRNLINQTDVNAAFETGRLQHVLLLGAEFGRQETDNVRFEGRFAGGAASLSVPIAASNVRVPLTFVQTASSGDNQGVARVAAVYMQDQIEFSPAFQLVLGVRYEDFRTEVTDRRTVGFPPGQQRDIEVTDTLWSPRVGLIYKPARNASLYASYSRTYQPRGGDQLTSLTLSNRNLAPEGFENYEVGAKWEVVPSFTLGAAVYQLDRDNVLALSDPNNGGSPLVPIGRQRTRGLELSAAGELTDRLGVVAAYSHTEGTSLDAVSGTVRAGNVLANLPEQSASLWTRYDAAERLGFGLGIVHQGDRFASIDNLVVLPAYTRVDAAVYYDVTERVSVQINVENLFDERYFQFAHNNNNITPGSPTAVRVGVTARF